MPRPLWKGSISFGLVNIPVGLYPAEKREELSLKMLDRRDLSPVRYKRVNEATGREVPWEEIVKGYEYAPGKRVVLTEDDLKRANPELSSTVEIAAFVDRDAIAPLFFEKPYYLAPIGKAGAKGYALLRETLKRTDKVAVAKVVIRTKESLAAVFPDGDMLVLDELRYATEIRPPDNLEVPEGSAEELGLSEKEVTMAERLVEGMEEPWKPEQYRDSYRDDLLALIERKAAHGGVAEEEPATKPKAGEVIDLMPLLLKSLEAREKPANGRKKASAAKPVKGEKPAGKDAAKNGKARKVA